MSRFKPVPRAVLEDALRNSPPSRANPGPLPVTGQPRDGGRLERVAYSEHEPIFRDGLAYVSVEDEPRRAVLGASDFLRITARDPSGPWLTRTRWWLDGADMLRAYSLHDQPRTDGLLVAAAILGAKEGDVIEVPADPLDMRLSRLRRIAA